MNTTRLIWSRDFRCSRIHGNVTGVMVLSFFFCTLPFAFYIGHRVWGPTVQKKLLKREFLVISELVYDWATSLGCLPFCYWRVSPSREQLHSQMRLHRFDVISLSIMSGRNNKLCNINTIGFVSVYLCMQSLWRFGCKSCNRLLGIHDPK